MRGALDDLGFPDLYMRIIPAYAGSTAKPKEVAGQPPDHPRVCGEHPVMHTAVRKNAGSSPRMRGAPVAQEGMPLRVGIIPAYAGSTHRQAFEGLSAEDHPRVCGEHPVVAFDPVVDAGSSPRMRGAL